MNNKERYLRFIKDFSYIGVSRALRELNFTSSSFYRGYLSLENMQKTTNLLREWTKELYDDIQDNKKELATKELNIDFAKEFKELGINKICSKLKIATSSLYSYENSDDKYERVVDEIKRGLDSIYSKYNITNKNID